MTEDTAIIVVEDDAKRSHAIERRLKAAGSPPRSLLYLLLACLLWPLSAVAQSGPAKRVLIVHSFGSAAPPFSVHALAFETELVTKIGERVDLDEVSLDMARYSDSDMQEAVVDYLEKRQLKWRPDIVVPIGSPAGKFVANYRERLWPETPILYASLDRRMLPPGALDKNATYIGQIFDVDRLIEDMLEAAPATNNIAVVIGATPLEQQWKQTFQKAAAPLTDRINFTYFDDLSFDQMLEKAKALPPDSFVFFLLLLRDAAGVTHNADLALARLHEVANAPINSIFEHQMGLGIVGGRLYQSRRIGKEAAAVAIRILRGEPASSIEPKLIEPLPRRYDWRELQRWNIDETRLPPGSEILYRPSTAWKQYRGWIILGGSIVVAQAILIFALLANLFRRRRAERSLAESEARFRVTADAAPVLLWMSGPDKRCTFLNKGWLEFTGRSLEQQLGDGWADGVHSEDVAQCVATYSTSFNAREPFAMQYRLRRHDGEYRWVTDNGVPRYDSRGTFVGYAGLCVDVTDLLNKDKALHEFEERVALAAETAHLGVWELDAVTKDLWLSDKVRKIFQFKPGQQVSYEEFQTRIHPEDREWRDAAIRRAIEERHDYEMEYRALLPDGTVRWIGARGRCVNDESGKPARLLAVAMDITERKQAEELFRLALEASPSGTLLVNDKGRIVLVNAHIEELFGYGRDELIDKPVEMLVPPRFADEYNKLRESFLAAPEVRGIGAGPHICGLRKDGTEFPVEIGVSPLQTPKGFLVLANIVDVTARKAAEAEAQLHRDQLELLSRVSLLGEMAASLAHELNQPLSAIVSNASAGMRFIDKGDADVGILREIMVDVEADGRRAHEIIDSVRQTIKKGKDGTRNRRPIDMNDTIGRVVHMVQPDAIAHSCEIETALARDLPPVEGDPVQIQQVLVNLMSNAFDSMRETTRARRKVRITTEPNGHGTIRVSVRDRGSGIPSEVREQMFDQFVTTKEEGLGMGLAIVRSIIEAHGGEIGGDNQKGGGALFYFTLPITGNHLS
jgi:PAS domain S-box-containing protein